MFPSRTIQQKLQRQRRHLALEKLEVPWLAIPRESLPTQRRVGGGTGMLASHNCFVLRPPSHWHPEPKSSLFKDTTRTGIPADLENPHQDKETGVKGHSRRRHRESSTGDWGWMGMVGKAWCIPRERWGCVTPPTQQLHSSLIPHSTSPSCLLS